MRQVSRRIVDRIVKVCLDVEMLPLITSHNINVMNVFDIFQILSVSAEREV